MSVFLHLLLPVLSFACMPSIPTETLMYTLPSSIVPATTTSRSTATTTTTCINECDAGWKYHVNGDGTPLCYKIITNTGQACANGETQCENNGAVVASVHSMADNTFIRGLAGLNTGNICIGLVNTRTIVYPYVASNRDKWRWLDGTAYDYQQWQHSSRASTEPWFMWILLQSQPPQPPSGTGCVVIINRFTCTPPTCGQTCNPGGAACGRWNDVSCTRASSQYSICSKDPVCLS